MAKSKSNTKNSPAPASAVKRAGKKKSGFVKGIIEYGSENLMYLAALALLLVATYSLSIAKFNAGSTVVLGASASGEYPDLPILSGGQYPVLSARGATLVDLDSSVRLYEKSPDAKFLPASTVKMMTALVTLDIYPLEKVITIADPSVDGQKMGLVSGEQITVQDLLKGLLIYSANDAGKVLAQNHPEGTEGFVGAMNAKARELNLLNTYFSNSTGLDGNGQFTTASDLATLSEIAMQENNFSSIVSQESAVVTSLDGETRHILKNTNELLGTVSGVYGVKTGWTQEARENLVSYVERDGHRIMVVVLGSQDRFGETTELIEWAFDNYVWEAVRPQ